MADIRLQPVQCQEHPALASQNGSQPLIVAQRHGQQLLVALQQVGDAALADHHAPLAQGAVDLRHAAVLAMAKRAHERDHVQAEFMLGERNGAFLLGPMHVVAKQAGGALATADLEPQPHRAVQGNHGAAVLVADAHGPAASRTLTSRAEERAFLLRLGSSLPAGHHHLLAARHPHPSTDSKPCHSRKKLAEVAAAEASKHPDKAVEVWATDEHRIGLKPIRRRVWAAKGQRPMALGHHRYKWLYVTAFVLPSTGETFWSVSNGISKPFFAALLALFAREAGAGRERIIVLGLDNAGWHSAANLAVPDGLRLGDP